MIKFLKWVISIAFLGFVLLMTIGYTVQHKATNFAQSEGIQEVRVIHGWTGPAVLCSGGSVGLPVSGIKKDANETKIYAVCSSLFDESYEGTWEGM